MSWSSSGPAAYAISLQDRKSVTGSYIAMSVFRPESFPTIANAKGHRYYIAHSPQDQVCKYSDAVTARKHLADAGAKVESMDYEGGHGWHGDMFAQIQKAMTWLAEDTK